VPADADGERPLARVEHHRDRLPVALVRLPEVGGLRHGRAPEVEGVKEPVLERDPVAAPEDGPVDDRRRGVRRRCGGIAVDRCETRRGSAGALVEPPARRDGATRNLGRRERDAGRRLPAPVGRALLQIGVGEKPFDLRRHEALGRVEDENRLVALQQRRSGA
jgi:hypothetical protein